MSKANKLRALLALAVLAFGCADMAQSNQDLGFSTCYDGVLYVRFSEGVSVKYNDDGSIATCN